MYCVLAYEKNVKIRFYIYWYTSIPVLELEFTQNQLCLLRGRKGGVKHKEQQT